MQKGTEKTENENGVRNFRNPDPLNCSHEGKSVTVTMTSGRIEAGILRVMGQYSIEMDMSNGRKVIINKASIIMVSVIGE